MKSIIPGRIEARPGCSDHRHQGANAPRLVPLAIRGRYTGNRRLFRQGSGRRRSDRTKEPYRLIGASVRTGSDSTGKSCGCWPTRSAPSSLKRHGARIEAGNWKSKVTPAAAVGSLLGWIAPGVPVIMAGDHDRAGRYVSRLLFTAARRRWREARALARLVCSAERGRRARLCGGTMMPWQSLQERQRLPGFGIDHIPVLGQGEGQAPLGMSARQTPKGACRSRTGRRPDSDPQYRLPRMASGRPGKLDNGWFP